MTAPETALSGFSLIPVSEHLLNRLGFPLFLLEPNEGFRFVYANAAALRAFDCDEKRLRILRYPRHAEFPLPRINTLWNLLDDALQTETTVRRFGDGSTRSLTIVLYAFPHNRIRYLLGYLLPDQPGHPELTAALHTAERAIAVRDRFLAHMSHELRTPLNGILGLSQLARDTESPLLARDYLEQIHQSGLHLQATLGDILEYCEIETGEISLNPVNFNPASLTENIIQAVRTRALAKNLALHCHLDPTLPAYLWGDARRLHQVLLSLVDNAIKFTDEGRVDIRVNWGAPQENQPVTVFFSVSDTGPGIVRDDWNRLFKPFEQLDQSDHRQHQGLGMGLALAWHLVKRMGGKGILIESKPGSGSTFSLELPFDLARASVAPQLAVESVGDLPLSGLNILVVEDNTINQMVICRMLEKAGATTTVAENGWLAVERVRQLPEDTYDAILMDLQMPVMDGLTATRLIRHDLLMRRVPIIAVTAHALSADRTACLEAGMNAHLTKPLQPQGLIGTLLGHLANRSSLLMGQSANDAATPLVTLVNLNQVFKEIIPNLPATLISLGNDEALYCDLARLFVSQHAGSLTRFRQHLDGGDPDQALKLLHALKELSSTLGLLPLHQAMARLCFRIEGGPDMPAMTELEEAETEMKLTLRGLRQLLLTHTTQSDKPPRVG